LDREQLGKQGQIHGVAETAAHENDVAIGLGLSHGFAGDIGGCAGAVFDHDLLPEHARSLLHERARKRIVTQLNILILAHQFRGFMLPDNQIASHENHVKIAQAVLADDGAQAQRLM
jgi:hypothetical protein